MRLVLDVDTGVDDACALLLAARHRRCRLVGVTCVAGNTGVDQVVRNTLTVLEVAGAGDGVPVARGAPGPLSGDQGPPRTVHGRDGMADLGLPAPQRHADRRSAVDLLADLVADAAQQGDPLTLLALAPLTNLASFLAVHGSAAAITQGLARIVVVGQPGGADPRDFNIAHDRAAAQAVVDSAARLGVPVLSYGMDVFDRVHVGLADAARLADGGGPGQVAAALVRFQCRRFGTSRATIGDAGALAAVLDPGGVRVRGGRVVDVDGARLARAWLAGVSEPAACQPADAG